jgi:hypothetical protein
MNIIMFNSEGYINTDNDRLDYINRMEKSRIDKYGNNYIEHIETIYYENDINDKIDEEYRNISFNELINIVLRMDMAITVETMKYIDGIIYDIGGINLWNNINIVDAIKIYQLLSIIKKTFGINDLNQIHNVSNAISLSLLNNRYDAICYLRYYDNKINSLAILYDDEQMFESMLKIDLDINNNSKIKYLHQLLFIDNNNKILDMIEYDYKIIAIYIGDLNDKQKVYWKCKDYKLFNEYFIGKIYDGNNMEVSYNSLVGINDDIKVDNIISRNIKLDTKRRRPSKKRQRRI